MSLIGRFGYVSANPAADCRLQAQHKRSHDQACRFKLVQFHGVPLILRIYAITSNIVRLVLVKWGRVMSLQAVPRTANHGGESSVCAATRS